MADRAGKKASQQDETQEKILDGRLWEEFCDALKSAGAVIQRDLSPSGAFDRAEGYRYLSRLTRLALEKFVEHADPTTPRFHQLSHETGKIGADNPDSYYQNATISGEHEYRLWGYRGTVAYLGIGAYYGHYGSSARSGCSGYLEAEDLKLNPDGSFEVILSSEEQSGNWIKMEPDTSMLIVRQNVLDWDGEELAELYIERLGAEGPPDPLEPSHFAEGLRTAAAFVDGTASTFAAWAEGFLPHTNELRPLDPNVTGGALGDPNIAYYMGYWKLEDDEALVVDVTPPECAYWNFQINNHWMESLDYRYHAISYNKHTAAAGPDGSVRLVVSAGDPGQPNWVDTAGHDRGTMCLRWIKAKEHPLPSTSVVKLAELTDD